MARAYEGTECMRILLQGARILLSDRNVRGESPRPWFEQAEAWLFGWLERHGNEPWATPQFSREPSHMDPTAGESDPIDLSSLTSFRNRAISLDRWRGAFEKVRARRASRPKWRKAVARAM